MTGGEKQLLGNVVALLVGGLIFFLFKNRIMAAVRPVGQEVNQVDKRSTKRPVIWRVVAGLPLLAWMTSIWLSSSPAFVSSGASVWSHGLYGVVAGSIIGVGSVAIFLRLIPALIRNKRNRTDGNDD